MSEQHTQYDSIEDALRKINGLLQEARIGGFDILQEDVGERLNPGDVYDAYIDINRVPSSEEELDSARCGPFAAIYLQRFPSGDPSNWLNYIGQTFDARYVKGFRQGFLLNLPEVFVAGETHYLRGGYDGIMAHAAVY